MTGGTKKTERQIFLELTADALLEAHANAIRYGDPTLVQSVERALIKVGRRLAEHLKTRLPEALDA